MTSNIERKLIVNEISLKNLLHYSNSIYKIDTKFNSLKRTNLKISGKGRFTKTKASTGAKMTMMNCLCFNQSINELITTTHDKDISLYNFFNKGEYIPKMHGYRDCVMDTDHNQLVKINDEVITKMKENKIFKKNLVDGLCVVAFDGVELAETKKDIKNLPEREHENDNICKYIKYLSAMNVGEKANIFIAEKQMLETEKITSKNGKLKAKTIGETTALIDMMPDIQKRIGKIIDVVVLDALFLTSKVMNKINKNNQYFVIRMEDKTKNIYKDAEGLFKHMNPTKKYEIVEVTEQITVKYSKMAKHKDYKKSKTKIKTRDITDNKINENKLIETKIQNKKNSTKETKTYEKVVRKIKAWSDEFEYASYEGKVRVVKTEETFISKGKEIIEEIYIATNMLTHDIKTVIKIMHLRWHIENNGFRKIKQNFNAEHIFIGELNAINYIFQIIKLVSNLLELYFKVRLKEKIKCTYKILKKKFELEINKTKEIGLCFVEDST